MRENNFDIFFRVFYYILSSSNKHINFLSLVVFFSSCVLPTSVIPANGPISASFISPESASMSRMSICLKLIPHLLRVYFPRK